MEIKVLSWNIWFDCHFNEVAAFLDSINPDIIAMQEVVVDDKERDVIGYLKTRGYQCVFSPFGKTKPVISNEPGRSFGNAIFTKHEIVSHETFLLTGESKRNAVRADIKIGQTVIHVFSTHLLHTHQQPSAIQEEQANVLLNLLPKEKIIVMGDFNATPESNVIQKIKQILIDTDPASHPTWCLYKEGCPTCKLETIDTRLDYIFTSKDIKTSSFEAENAKGSDHLPISASIEI